MKDYKKEIMDLFDKGEISKAEFMEMMKNPGKAEEYFCEDTLTEVEVEPSEMKFIKKERKCRDREEKR